METVKAATELT